METSKTEQKETHQTATRTKQAPGDDGFQSLSMRFRGATLSPEDLTNRHEAQLIGEFFSGSDRANRHDK
jgi:hypothetical protein